MNANEKFIAADAHVDEAAIKPLPNSRKIYVVGSRPDIRVPMREIVQADTDTAFGGEKNPPIYVYDCSRPYSEPQARIDIRQGLRQGQPLFPQGVAEGVALQQGDLPGGKSLPDQDAEVEGRRACADADDLHGARGYRYRPRP